MHILDNPFRGHGLDCDALTGVPFPSCAAARPLALLANCPAAVQTRLWASPDLAERASVAELWLKDERDRMGLGSFKALGAAYAIALQAPESDWPKPAKALRARVFVTASAGNHGLSVAAGARVFGARAVIFLSETVPEAFADRLRGFGADIVRAGAIYEDSMAAARQAAATNGWSLLSDSSWPGYTAPAYDVMEGYLVLVAEIVDQMAEPPTHILLQAGVGGMAAAVAAYLRQAWGEVPRIIVVEPEAAPALHDSIRAGHPVVAVGPVSNMGRLDCKEPSLIALAGLSRDADAFALISDDVAAAAMPIMERCGAATTPSGGAGVAAALGTGLGLTARDRVLCVLSEASV